jgi:CBS domain-containing protein
MLRLRDIMTRDVTSVSPEMPLDEFAELLTARHIGGAPVVSGRKVVGVVSAADVVTLAAMNSGEPPAEPESEAGDRWASELDLSPLEEEELPAGYFTGLWDITGEGLDGTWSEFTDERRESLHRSTVADVMSSDVLSLPPDTPIATAADFLKNRGVHRVLVISDDVLEGIVTSMDIVDAVAKQQISEPAIVYPHAADFDTGWAHEPIVPEHDPYPVRSLDGQVSPTVARYFEEA